MACNVCRQVGATYRSLWTKIKQNSQHRKQGKTEKRYKGTVNQLFIKQSTIKGEENHYSAKALILLKEDLKSYQDEKDGFALMLTTKFLSKLPSPIP
jgi:predicted transcriptional regulator